VLFISFEGGEGSGKSTQAKMLVKYLTQKGYSVFYTREPGGPDISEQIREILLNPKNRCMNPKTELLLYMASRAQHVEEFIKKALSEDRVVICDRYTDSSLAYQGGARGISEEVVNFLNDFSTSELYPDITFLFDIAPEEGINRVKLRQKNLTEEMDRIETEKMEFHHKVRNRYLNIAKNNSERFFIIDASTSINDIWEIIKSQVEQKLEAK